MKKYGLLFFTVTILSLAGCSGNYLIDSSSDRFKIDSSSIPKYKRGNNVSLVNSYAKSALTTLYKTEKDHWTGDLQEYTNTCITLMKGELKKKGIGTGDDSAARIVLKVQDASVTSGAFFHSRLVLQAKLPNGELITAEGSSGTAGSVYRVIDSALMRATVKILQHEKLVEYLSK